ncbi:hypothetical protein [Paremcibacter congregatus]|uniref:hypothetical protein n=1 Tax=Paremcibacter congregatus TaxID=2043170 RepID=UPI0030EC64F8
MTEEVSFVEITGTISGGRDGRNVFRTLSSGKGLSFTVFHQSPAGWGPLHVALHHPHDIRNIKAQHAGAGWRVRIKGQLKYTAKFKSWSVVVPNNRPGLLLYPPAALPGLGCDATAGVKDYAQ